MQAGLQKQAGSNYLEQESSGEADLLSSLSHLTLSRIFNLSKLEFLLCQVCMRLSQVLFYHLHVGGAFDYQ